MAFFYQIFIQFFSFSIRVAFLFNKKAKLFVKGRRRLFAELGSKISLLVASDSKLIWFHCASLGEFEQARPLIEKFKVQGLKFKVLITFFSPSGYAIRKNYEGADFVFYLPVDTKSNVKRFLSIIKPAQVFFVKYDFWFNYLYALHIQEIPTYLVSANFREEQFKGFYGMYLRKVLPFFSHLFVQNENSQKVLSEKNISNVTVIGDLRFDKVAENALKPKKVTLLQHFTSCPALLFKEKGVTAKPKIIVCGSSWEKDEEIIANYQLSADNMKFIIAPHEINEEHIQKLLSLFPGALRYSFTSKEPATTALNKLEAAQVLIIDNIGMLANLYQYADVAYIGGGFGEGIHNILEAVAFGVPVIFGPNHHKFPEAHELAEQGGAFSISNTEDFKKAMNLLLSDEKILQMASLTCKNFVGLRKGATERILSKIKMN